MPPAIVGDAGLFYFLWLGTADWPSDQAWSAMVLLLAWMIFSKFIKLITHFVRYPVDILLWPVSIIFGWFHGAIKFYALATLSEVSHFEVAFVYTGTDLNIDHLGKPSRRRCG